MGIREFQDKIGEWISEYGVSYFSELTNMAILTEETGEVARLMARMYGEQSFKEEITSDEQKIALRDELCDILWVVACIANQTSIDLEEGIISNFDKKTRRDVHRHVNNPKLK